VPRQRWKVDDDELTTRVLLLNTNSIPHFVELAQREIHNVIPPGVEVELSFPDNWETLVVDEYTEALSIPYLLEQAKRAKTGRYDAVIVNMHCDPGIEALREMLDTPVVGLGETSILLAAHLAEKFSMLTVGEGLVRLDRRIVKKMGVESKLASIRTFGSAATASRSGGDLFTKERVKYKDEIIDQCRTAVAMDGARAIYLAGSVFGYLVPGIAQELMDLFRNEGYGTIPVIEPLRAALNMARLLADLRIGRSFEGVHLSHLGRTSVNF
jgi:allantoin racemase